MASKIVSAARKLVRIQYVSDIHLDFYDKVPFPLLVKPNARYLALAGDIGHPSHPNYKAFFQYASLHWDKVFYVPGNHEYYNKLPSNKWKLAKPHIMEECDAKIREIVAPYRNVHLLTPGAPSVHLAQDNIAVVGSTLWSYIPPKFYGTIRLLMNDYRYIAKQGHMPIVESDINALHRQHYKALMNAIQYWAYQKVPVCVITHHMPSYALISPTYVGQNINYCFASNCERLMLPHVKGWIYGHTRNAATGMIKGTFTAVNSRGYPNESVRGFNTNAYMELNTTGEGEESERGDKPLQDLCLAAKDDIE